MVRKTDGLCNGSDNGAVTVHKNEDSSRARHGLCQMNQLNNRFYYGHGDSNSVVRRVCATAQPSSSLLLIRPPGLYRSDEKYMGVYHPFHAYLPGYGSIRPAQIVWNAVVDFLVCFSMRDGRVLVGTMTSMNSSCR